MTPPQPDDHTLNACLARVIGKEIHWVEKQQAWFLHNKAESVKLHPVKVWTPITDASQMEEVEAWLKKNGVEWEISTGHFFSLYYVDIITTDKKFSTKDPDKKRAFAVAVWEMEQAQKETT